MAWPFSRETTAAPEQSVASQEPTLVLPSTALHPQDLEADSPTEVFAAEQSLDESVAEGVVEPAAQTDALDEWRRQFDTAHQALTPQGASEALDEQTVWGEVDRTLRAGEVEELRHLVGIEDQAPVVNLAERLAEAEHEAETFSVADVVATVADTEPTVQASPPEVTELQVIREAVRLIELLKQQINNVSDSAHNRIDEVQQRLDHHTEQLTGLKARVETYGQSVVEVDQKQHNVATALHGIEAQLSEFTRRLDLIETSVAGESEDPTVAMEALLRSLPENGYKAFALQRWAEVLHAAALCRNGDAMLKAMNTKA